MAPYFRLQWKIDAVEEQGVDIPMMNDRKNFCLSYHFKGVCNLHCDVRHSYCTMFQADIGQMSIWKYRFCGADSFPHIIYLGNRGVWERGRRLRCPDHSELPDPRRERR